MRVIGVISKYFRLLNVTLQSMISGFLTSVISSPTTPAYRGTPYAIIDFTIFYSGFFSSEAFDKRTNRVGTDVADKHARYISETRYLVHGIEKVTNELGDNGAHRCVDYCFCGRTAIISAAKVRHCKRKDCPDALFLCRGRWPTGHVFLASSCLTPNKGICSI